MEKFSCLIIEDEPLAAEVLQDYIAQVEFLECKAVCRDGIYAMQVLQQQKIDVIFLDIHLPKIKGLDFLRTLQNPPQVIITTAYRDYALDGYELNVVDYLLKPIGFNRFLAAVNKLKKAESAPQTEASEEPQHLQVNINKKRIKISFDDILFLESRREYVAIVTDKQTFLVKITLSQMEQEIPKQRFLRVQRSFIVARKRIDAFTAIAIEIGGHRIPIGRNYRAAVLPLL